MSEFKPLPDIESVKAKKGHSIPVNIDDLDHIVKDLSANMDIPYRTAKRLVQLFFQEIRSAILAGERVNLYRFGSFMISRPLLKGNKVRVFAKFTASNQLRDSLNGKNI